MIVAQLQPERPILSKSVEVSGDPLSDRLQSFPAGGLMGRIGADEFARAVIDSEDGIPLIDQKVVFNVISERLAPTNASTKAGSVLKTHQTLALIGFQSWFLTS